MFAAAAQAQAHEARGMALVGAHSLEGRSSYQPVIHKVGERWIAFVGHHAGSAMNPLTGKHEGNGTSILDVTEVRAPKLLAHIPGEGAQMARYCNGYLLRSLGHSAHEVWDVRDPSRPSKASTVVSGLSDTHKSWWECDTGIAYLVSGAPGWRTSRMTQVFDLSDPRRPKFIRNFGLVGQQPGATGPVPTGLHGMISAGPSKNRIYFGHGTNAGGVLQIVDRRKLLEGAAEPTEANLLAPQVGRLDLDPQYGAHTTFPVLGLGGRDYVVIVNEVLSTHCREARQKVWIADVTDETRPKEIGYFVPAGDPLTNNVEVDERGYIYIVDRGSLGMHILKPMGPDAR